MSDIITLSVADSDKGARIDKFISENIDDSVRDLEGVINSLMAY